MILDRNKRDGQTMWSNLVVKPSPNVQDVTRMWQHDIMMARKLSSATDGDCNSLNRVWNHNNNNKRPSITSRLMDCNFLIRLLHKDTHWHDNHITFIIVFNFLTISSIHLFISSSFYFTIVFYFIIVIVMHVNHVIVYYIRHSLCMCTWTDFRVYSCLCLIAFCQSIIKNDDDDDDELSRHCHQSSYCNLQNNAAMHLHCLNDDFSSS